IELIKDRIHNYSQIEEELEYLIKLPGYETKLLVREGDEDDATKTLEFIKTIIENISAKDYDTNNLKNIIFKEIEQNKLNRGAVLWTTRVSITGLKNSPDLFATMDIIGKKSTIERINIALNKLSG
ncbi:hypothetical protein ACFL04_05045, partial [Patescibacteria group bacterium]